MNPIVETYTAPATASLLPDDIIFFLHRRNSEDMDYSEPDAETADSWPLWQSKYPYIELPLYKEYPKEGFIGVLSDEEASRMRTELGLFRTQFDEEVAQRNQVLFGE